MNADKNNLDLSLQEKEGQRGFSRLTWVLVLLWSVVLALSLFWSMWYVGKSAYEMALNALDMNITQDLVFRAWASGHGGVYVPVTSETPPNPNLAHIKERDVLTASGRQLTLINPAYMMRQVHEIAQSQHGVNGRLVSLKPISPPRNTADAWEAEALDAFAAGALEASTVSELNGQAVLRLIKPFDTKEECMSCHAHQGFQLGEVYGGISVAIPLGPYQAYIASARLYLMLAHGIIWLVGFGGILSVMRGMAAYTLRWQKSEKKYRTIVNNTNDALFICDFTGEIFDLNENACSMLGCTQDELIGANLLKILNTTDYSSLSERMDELMGAGSMVFESCMRNSTGCCVPVEVSIKVVSKEGSGILQGFVRDITERKKAEEKILKGLHDSLTGLYNRAFLEQEIIRLDTENLLPVSVIMVDLNGLKLVNDTYGHSVGDEMLMAAAEVLKKTCRTGDIVGRYGGDEFVILLPATTHEDAAKVSRRIIEECGSTMVGDIPLSMSVGFESKVNQDVTLVGALQEAEDSMYRNKLITGRSDKSAVLSALLKALAEKSDETEEHGRRMQGVALKIGEKLGLSQAELDRLALSVYLHDIGKITIPEEILMKTGHITEEEWLVIKQHPVTGYRIARSTEKFSHVAGEVLAHHERWDGTGYPEGLKGDKIPLLARIVAIADAYDVMTNGRSYKQPMTQIEVIEEMKKGAGSQFDPELTHILLALLAG